MDRSSSRLSQAAEDSYPKCAGTSSKSLREADKCLQIGAHIAAAAMAGRALEAVCRHYSTEDTYLGAGIKELRDKGIIDARLYKWSEELRDQRNAAAHANDTEISSQDAEDILTFTCAIVDYAFMLVLPQNPGQGFCEFLAIHIIRLQSNPDLKRWK